MKRQWLFQPVDITNLTKEPRLTGISEVCLKILVNRGIDTVEEIEKFMFGSIRDLHDTRLMSDAEKAVDIILESINNDEEIVCYSDYDNDGVASAVVIVSLLRKLGATANHFENNRFVQGYGMNKSGIDELIKKFPNTKLIITTDNGIMSHEGVIYAKNLGLKVIVTDHHEQGDTLPPADAVVDPKRKDDQYPFKGLCGAGVAFKLMLLLYWKKGEKLQPVYDMLDVVGMATVGDIVPLIDENRIFVKEGLELIRAEKNPVFKVLREVTEVSKIDAHFTLAFIYVPMINAIGRMDGDPSRAIDMFLTDNEDEIKQAILYLKEINEERKALTEVQCEEAEIQLEQKGLKNIIVLYKEDFHEGIIGLIAGRLKEKYNRPVIVFTKHNGILKGSGRSIDNFHLKERMDDLAPLLLGYGGHAKAGGLSIEEHNLEKFEEAINDLSKRYLNEKDFIKKFKIDYIIDSKTVTFDIVDELKRLEPYGESFSKPLLGIKNFTIKENPFYMGKEKNHVKLIGDNISLIMFKQADFYKKIGQPKSVKALGFPEVNVYKNNASLQFMVEGDNIVAC